MTAADGELLDLLRSRTRRKLFADAAALTIHDQGGKYEQAQANTGGVGFACFATAAEQNKAFNEAFRREAIAARPYIYALEQELIRRLIP